MRRAWLPVLAAAVLLAGCGGDGLPAERGYEDSSKAIARFEAGDRGEPVSMSGTGAGGERVDLAELRGAPVVLNIWYVDCPPCRAEAPALAKVSQDYADEGVRFVGLNIRNDSAEAIRAFEEDHGISYPSIRDGDGTAFLALRGIVPGTPPSTLVLDGEGRVAAILSGLARERTLAGLLDEVLAESGTKPGAGAAG